MRDFRQISERTSRHAKAFMLSLVALLCCSVGAYAQDITVTGVVKDAMGELPGVSVAVKGTTNGTITGIDGSYSLQVKKDAILVFSFVGMKTQEVAVNGRKVIDVTMTDDTEVLDEVVVVGYGTAKKQSLTGAVSAVRGEELLKAPATNVSQMLGGVIPGISSVQESGEPGLDQAALRIRGARYSAAYVVDGFPVDNINDLDPNDIESISVLKDGAAAAVYGLSAGNGVVIVTTKKGSEGKSKITYDASFGISMNANFPKFMNGPQFAYYYNVADMMDKLANKVIADPSEYQPIFTQANIAAMLNGDPTDGWDNVNYVDKVFGTGFNQKHSVTLQGGNEKLRYFTSIGYLGQKGNIDRFSYRRYNLRSNIEAQVAKNFKMTMGVSGSVGRRSTPGFVSGGSDDSSQGTETGFFSIAHQTIQMHPYLPEKIDGLYSGVAPKNNSSLPNSPLAAIYESGYKRTHSNSVMANVSLEYDAPWLKGLKIKGNGSYSYSTSYNKLLDTYYYVNMATMPSSTNELYYTKTLDPRGNSYNKLGEGQSNYRQLVGQGSINYANSFGKHNVEALALMEIRQNKSNGLSAYAKNVVFPGLPELGLSTPADDPIGGWSNESRTLGYVFRLKYDYDNKYLAEVTGRYDGSYKFAGNVSGKRWGFFPSGSVAWRVSEESFMEDVDIIDDLKIRASVGLLGTDNVSAYRFLNTYAFDSQVNINNSSQTALYSYVIGNPILTWEKTLSYNVGFDLSMWNNLLGLEVDGFYKYNYDILMSMGGDYPPSMGGYYQSTANFGAIDTKGIDVLVKHNNSFNLAGKPFNYTVSANVTYATSKWLKYTDGANIPNNRKRVGTKVGLVMGWIADGLYRTEEEIDNSAWYGSRPNIGDIKYVDVNGDGQIDESDKGLIGRPNRPELTYGLNVGGSWNGFDFNMQFTGGALFDISLTGTYYNGYDDNTVWTQTFKENANSPLFLVENAYSVYNPDGSFPRLTLSSTQTGGDNGLASTFWFRDGKYIRLKSAQLGYTIPKNITRKLNIENLRVYVQGSNLFTISGLPDGIDPESPGVNNGYYPQQRTIMGGISLTF